MDTLRLLIFRPLRAVAKNLRYSRLHSPQKLSRFCGCFDERCFLSSILSHTAKKTSLTDVFLLAVMNCLDAQLNFAFYDIKRCLLISCSSYLTLIEV